MKLSRYFIVLGTLLLTSLPSFAQFQPGNPVIVDDKNAAHALPNVIYIHQYLSTNPSDPLHAAQASCPNNLACDLRGSAGDIYPLPSPFWLGGGFTSAAAGPNALPQTLHLDGASIMSTDNSTFPQDDGIIIGSRSRVYCTGGSSGQIPGRIGMNRGARLNSVVTSPGGVILNAYENSHPYKLGQVIFDGANVEIVTKAGTSSGSATRPSWPGSAGGSVNDGSMTWTRFTDGRISGGGAQMFIDGCNIGAHRESDNSNNNVLRISGVQGGKVAATFLDIGPLGAVSTGGSDGASGSVGILVDPGQDNGFCKGPRNPLACCTGAGAGQCESGAAGENDTNYIDIKNIFIVPGNPTDPGGPYAAVYLNRVAQVEVHTGQIADIMGTRNVALAVVRGGRLNHIHDIYFETNGPNQGQQNVNSDSLLLDGTNGFIGEAIWFGKNGSNSIANCVHITGSNTTHVRVTGAGINRPCLMQYRNDLQPQDNIPSTSGGPNFAVDYTNLNHPNVTPPTFSTLRLSYYMRSINCRGPENPIGCCTDLRRGDCAAVPPASADAAHSLICGADADACTAGVSYSNTGGHNWMCLLQENTAGTAWKETGLPCF